MLVKPALDALIDVSMQVFLEEYSHCNRPYNEVYQTNSTTAVTSGGVDAIRIIRYRYAAIVFVVVVIDDDNVTMDPIYGFLRVNVDQSTNNLAIVAVASDCHFLSSCSSSTIL